LTELTARYLRDPALRFSLAVYVPLRLVLLAIAALACALYPGSLLPDPVYRPYLGAQPINEGWGGLLLGAWQRWDTLWYMLIAREGYTMADTRIFAPPLYPWLMRLAGAPMGGSDAALLLGGLIVSNVACIALFVYLYRLVEMEWSVTCAKRSIVYMALFPTAFYLLAAYAESLYVLCAVAAFYHARRGQWLTAGIWGFFAPLARLPGVVILVPLGWEFVRQWWNSRYTPRPLAWWHGWPLGLAALGGLLFPLYAYVVTGSGSLLAPFTIHTDRFAGRFAMPWESLWHAGGVLLHGGFRFIEPFDFAFALLFIGLTVAALIKLPLMYGLYMVVVLLGTLTKVADVQPLLSLSRYVLVLFPAFVLLAKLGRHSAWWNRLIVYTGVALLIFFTGQFAIWGWVG
jgi:hypothetical protein